MTEDNKDRLLRLLQQYKELGIAEQIDFDKSMTDSLIANSVALVDSDDGTAIDDSERKWSIKPSAVYSRQRRNHNGKYRDPLRIYRNYSQTLPSSAYGVRLSGSPWRQQEQNLQQKRVTMI